MWFVQLITFISSRTWSDGYWDISGTWPVFVLKRHHWRHSVDGQPKQARTPDATNNKYPARPRILGACITGWTGRAVYRSGIGHGKEMQQLAQGRYRQPNGWGSPLLNIHQGRIWKGQIKAIGYLGHKVVYNKDCIASFHCIYIWYNHFYVHVVFFFWKKIAIVDNKQNITNKIYIYQTTSRCLLKRYRAVTILHNPTQLTNFNTNTFP